MRKDILTIGITMFAIGTLLLSIQYTNLLTKIKEEKEEVFNKNYKSIPYKFEKWDRIKLIFDADNTVSEVFFCDEKSFEKWGGGEEIKKYGTLKNKTKGEINFVVPESGIWYLVFNNKYNEKNVNIKYKIEFAQYTPILILFSFGVVIFVIGGVLIPISLFLKKKRKKKKVEEDFILVEEEDFIEEVKQYNFQPINQLVCKSCKRIIDNPERFYYKCPFCGRSLR